MSHNLCAAQNLMILLFRLLTASKYCETRLKINKSALSFQKSADFSAEYFKILYFESGKTVKQANGSPYDC